MRQHRRTIRTLSHCFYDLKYHLVWTPKYLGMVLKAQIVKDELRRIFESIIYIPKNAPPGLYTGIVSIKEGGKIVSEIPVALEVYNFDLPDTPTAKTMLFVGNDTLNRYIGEEKAWTTEGLSQHKEIRDHHFQVAHRHKISLLDHDLHKRAGVPSDQPGYDWSDRLDGDLFTKVHGYEGPGTGVGNGIYGIGMYSSWSWKNEDKQSMWEHTNNWATWFENNAPDTDYFLYLIDESDDYEQINTWAGWMNENPGIGQKVQSLATMPLTHYDRTPELDIPVSGMYLGDPDVWEPQSQKIIDDPNKKFFMYNGGRPGSGSFVTEEDGIALCVTAWAQFKKEIDRWFYWESTYYNNYYQGGTGQTNVFDEAFTFGGHTGADEYHGETGWNYSNGDGVMFYHGTDTYFPHESYNVDGPFASLRLKHWRRGIQDVDYLALAQAKDPEATQKIINNIIPKVLWEYGVHLKSDPTYVTTEISWLDDPDVWEEARLELARIIVGQ